MWQDDVIGAASAGFSLLLLPTVFNRHAHIPVVTSLSTAVLLAIEAGAFWTLNLQAAAATTAAASALWCVIAAIRRTAAPSHSLEGAEPTPATPTLSQQSTPPAEQVPDLSMRDR